MPAAEDEKSHKKSETNSETYDFIREKYANFQTFVRTLIAKNEKLSKLIPVDSGYSIFITVFRIEFAESIKMAKNDHICRDISVTRSFQSTIEKTIDRLLLEYEIVLIQADYDKLCRYMQLWATVA